MTAQLPDAELTLAYEIHARSLIKKAMALDVVDLWGCDDFADIGEADWEVIVDRAAQIADTLDAAFTPEDRHAARRTLAARVEETA